jgi:hypothetical protein
MRLQQMHSMLMPMRQHACAAQSRTNQHVCALSVNMSHTAESVPVAIAMRCALCAWCLAFSRCARLRKDSRSLATRNLQQQQQQQQQMARMWGCEACLQLSPKTPTDSLDMAQALATNAWCSITGSQRECRHRHRVALTIYRRK